MLDYETRMYLRHAISDRKRAKIALARSQNPKGHCSKCGVPHDEYSPACSACWCRKRRARLRDIDQEPDARQARRRAHQCQRCGTPLQDTNPECRTCWERQWARNKRMRRAA